MTKIRAYITLAITVLFLLVSILFYSLEVSKFSSNALSISSLVLAFLLSGVSNVWNFYLLKRENHFKIKEQTGFLKYRHQITDWFSFITTSILAILFLFVFIVFNSGVQLSSMSPTLEPGDRVLVYHFNYQPIQNDIVIIRMIKDKYPNIPAMTFIDNQGHAVDEVYFVKRIVAAPGDQIAFTYHEEADAYYTIEINGVTSSSPHGQLYTIFDITEIQNSITNGYLDAGKYLVFGDNVGNSNDSRSFGAVDEADIFGKVIFRVYWPIGVVR